MQSAKQSVAVPPVHLDYSLTGVNATIAVEKGLAEADWYQCQVPREIMRGLLKRRDGPAILHTLLWFLLILTSGLATYKLRGSLWMLLSYAIYSVIYTTPSDSRWHETGHGTAFKTDWMNNTLYEIASFMVMREPTMWRWSHNRHHSDTIIVGRDPEITVPRPVDLKSVAMKFFSFQATLKHYKSILLHAVGCVREEETIFVPEMEFQKIFWKARIYLAIYVLIVVLAFYTHSILPVLFVMLPNFFGTWLMVIYGMTQHAGLAENVLDHRLNCRTVYMNPVHRFLYWNMNYHLEHHMFPLVPYHALPSLHAAIRSGCPPPYPSLWDAWKEIAPALLRQVKDPAYHVKRVLPETMNSSSQPILAKQEKADAAGWILVGPANHLARCDVIRFDYRQSTFAISRDETGNLYATDGLCTHGNMHLSEGIVVGKTIECSKHNGRFNLIDGSPARAPICRGLATYLVEEREGQLYLNILRPGGVGARIPKTVQLRVVSNRSVATFIKELILEPINIADKVNFTPGDYLQINIPSYEQIHFSSFEIPDPFAIVWRNQHIFDLVARNPLGIQWNNYSIASNVQTEHTLRLNVRIATPPPGQECVPGKGSSYIFSLRVGDIVTAIGPFGNFHPKPTKHEMVYIGGGAGMAPLRAHLSHLLETGKSARRISFWYGARSRQEIFYDVYFQKLATLHSNFSFHVALSSPLPEDQWTGFKGFIHEVVLEQYLRAHPNPQALEYYLCGPPMMVKACTKMLTDIGVSAQQVAYDEF
jgi:fatty acid desaturase/NAD(P)H-flavin reductase/nitrite reductase/ring-hydroxylating ferredoxin subunit